LVSSQMEHPIPLPRHPGRSWAPVRRELASNSIAGSLGLAPFQPTGMLPLGSPFGGVTGGTTSGRHVHFKDPVEESTPLHLRHTVTSSRISGVSFPPPSPLPARLPLTQRSPVLSQLPDKSELLFLPSAGSTSPSPAVTPW
jgi:hypothetical protein